MMVMLMMMMISSVTTATTTTTTTAPSHHHDHPHDRTTKYILMGLPKSGSYWIHQFIHCMNDAVDGMSRTTREEEEEEIPKVTTLQQQQQQQQRRRLSSAHYCCDPQYSGEEESTPFTTNTITNIETTSFFPCPLPMIPCGTCLQQQQLQHGAHTSNGTTMNQTNHPPHWMTACGNYQVYSNFHVEGMTRRSSHPRDPIDKVDDEEYTFFLPQHYTLPYLIHHPNPEEEEDRTTTSSSSSTTTTNTVWILNHRSSAEQWATHVSHWYSITHRILNAFHVPYYYDSTTTTTTTPTNESPEEENEPDTTTAHQLLWTLEHVQHELDTTSFERIHNRTDHQRRHVELMAIHEHHLHKIHQFVHDYNHNNNHNSHRTMIQLYDIDIDDVEQTPMRLARALGYVVGTDNDTEDTTNDPTTTATIQQQCWNHIYHSNMPQFEQDYTQFDLTTTFRASA